jgi:leader peptidase (prepilin peptidase) / N-methyltransferase
MDIARDTSSEPRGHAPGPRALLATGRGWTAAGVGFVVIACFVRFGFGGEAIVAAAFAGVLVVLAAIDIEQRIVPNRIVLPAIGLVLAGELALFPDRTPEFVLACVGAGIFLLLPLLVYPAGMGLGDVKLAMLLGAGLGSAVIGAFLVGFMAAFLVAVGIIFTRGAAGRKTAIPFAPFLALGGLVALFFS